MNHMLNKRWVYLLAIVALLGIFVSNPLTLVPANAGGTYVFSVTCTSGESLIVEWRTGDIDPGKEYSELQRGRNTPVVVLVITMKLQMPERQRKLTAMRRELLKVFQFLDPLYVEFLDAEVKGCPRSIFDQCVDL